MHNGVRATLNNRHSGTTGAAPQRCTKHTHHMIHSSTLILVPTCCTSSKHLYWCTCSSPPPKCLNTAFKRLPRRPACSCRFQCPKQNSHRCRQLANWPCMCACCRTAAIHMQACSRCRAVRSEPYPSDACINITLVPAPSPSGRGEKEQCFNTSLHKQPFINQDKP